MLTFVWIFGSGKINLIIVSYLDNLCGYHRYEVCFKYDLWYFLEEFHIEVKIALGRLNKRNEGVSNRIRNYEYISYTMREYKSVIQTNEYRMGNYIINNKQIYEKFTN